jgi:DNA-binding GntR family transcriptional regulator
VGDILWGFHFDARPGQENSRWLHAFGLLLLARLDHLILSYGRRIPDGRSRGHDAYPVGLGTSEELAEIAKVMETEGLTELANWNSVASFRQSLAAPNLDFHIYSRKAAAALAARQGDFGDALQIIAECESYIKAYEEKDLASMLLFSSYATEDSELGQWVRPTFEELLRLRERCLSGDTNAIQSLLNEWRSHTISQLGIEDICLTEGALLEPQGT